MSNNPEISKAGAEYSRMLGGINKVFETRAEAENLMREFNTAFPDSKIQTVVGATKGASDSRKVKLFFRGDVNSEQGVLDWLKEKGII